MLQTPVKGSSADRNWKKLRTGMFVVRALAKEAATGEVNFLCVPHRCADSRDIYDMFVFAFFRAARGCSLLRYTLVYGSFGGYIYPKSSTCLGCDGVTTVAHFGRRERCAVLYSPFSYMVVRFTPRKTKNVDRAYSRCQCPSFPAVLFMCRYGYIRLCRPVISVRPVKPPPRKTFYPVPPAGSNIRENMATQKTRLFFCLVETCR